MDGKVLCDRLLILSSSLSACANYSFGKISKVYHYFPQTRIHRVGEKEDEIPAPLLRLEKHLSEATSVSKPFCSKSNFGSKQLLLKKNFFFQSNFIFE
jgi:hypothetical protein